MFSTPLHYRFDSSKPFVLPRMVDVRQRFESRQEADIESAVQRELAKIPPMDLSGKRIALTAGSRGVANQARILRAVADWFKTNNALPFIVPGMGSHGGATAEGQRDVLTGYGITEQAMGVPILSGMETVQLGTLADGHPVYCDANAFAADYIFPVHRVKPHTGFKAEIESGLCKMLVIGLGKHVGAVAIHTKGVPSFGSIIPAAAQVILASGKVPGGLAILENALDQTMLLKFVPSGIMVEREKELLALAKRALPRISADRADVLVVEEIGKHISGTGMDPNITGRAARPLAIDVCQCHRIAVLSVGEESHGNAVGIGLADVTTMDAVRTIDWSATYTNSITAGVPEISRLPMVANTDYDAIRIALASTPNVEASQARIIQIRNTMELTRIRMSETYLDNLHPDCEAVSAPAPMQFDQAGRLARL